MQTVLKDVDARMNAALEALGREFASVRTGRAAVGLLEPIRVDYYGTPTPISQMASVSTPDARTLVIQPWEASQLKEIEKAITKADLGIQPVNDGKLIRLPIPALTEERRKELVKVVRRVAEDGKVAIRNVRRDVLQHLRDLVVNGEVGDDEERRAEQQVQKVTDEHTKSIDDLLKAKEAEIMEV